MVRNLYNNPKRRFSKHEMKQPKFLYLALLGALALSSQGTALAQDASRWHNVDVNEQNREPRRAAFFAYETQDKAQSFEKKGSANYLSMEGMWKFNFVKDHNKRPANFLLPTMTTRHGPIFLCRDSSSSTALAMLHIKMWATHGPHNLIPTLLISAN